jgi:catechol-2,3-dioxygenase
MVSAINGFCELTLETRDLRAMEFFYCEIFMLPVLSREDDRVWLACGPRARLGLWMPGRKEHGDRGGRHVHFAFSVDRDQLDRLAGLAGAAGATVDGPIEHDGGDRSLYLEDPERNIVEAWDFFERGREVDDLLHDSGVRAPVAGAHRATLHCLQQEPQT